MKRKVDSLRPTDADKIAERLRNARDQMELTQAELAKKAGLSRSAVVHYEKGNAVPGALELIKLSKILGKSPNFLLSGAVEFFDSNRPEHLLSGNSQMEIVSKIALCLTVLPRDVMESISALLMGLVRAKLTNEEFAKFQETAQFLRSQLPTQVPEINAFAEQAAMAMGKPKKKRRPRPRT